jgi:adenosine deaminase
LNDFLKCFDLPLTLLQTKAGIREAVRLVLENIRRQGVVYAEIRFAPQLHTQRGLTQEDAVQAAVEGLKNAELPGNLILCCMRGADNQAENRETVELARQYLVANGGVAALDLAGAEGLFPTTNYRELFALATGYGVPFTIHAGEAAGPDSIRAALDMGARRIGHGVRLREAPALLERVRDQGVFLEMCPTSNRQTRAVDMADYPLTQYLNAGLRVTLNTDDMAISRITLPGEFQYMEREFGLTAAQETQLLRNAVDGAFADENTKESLRNKLAL